MVDSFSLPLGELFTTANYRTAFDRLGIFTAYRNSLIISCTVAAVVILLAGNLSFAIVVLTGYIKSLPIELEEAAYMEGSHCFTGGASGYHRIRVPSEIHHQRNDSRSGKGVIPIISERQFISIRKARGCLCSVVSIFRENPFFSFFFGQKEV